MSREESESAEIESLAKDFALQRVTVNSQDFLLEPLVFCQICLKTEDLRICGKCKRTYYCNAEHQEKHWKESHHATCTPSDVRHRAISEYSDLFMQHLQEQTDLTAYLPPKKKRRGEEEKKENEINKEIVYNVYQEILDFFMDCCDANGWNYRKSDKAKFGITKTRADHNPFIHGEEESDDDDGAQFCEIYGASYIPIILVEDFLPYYIFQIKISHIQGLFLHPVLSNFLTWLEEHNLLHGITSEKKKELNDLVKSCKDLPRLQALEERIQAYIARGPKKSAPCFEDIGTGNVVVGVFSVVGVDIPNETMQVICKCNFMNKMQNATPYSMREDERVFTMKVSVSIVVSCDVGWNIIGSIMKMPTPSSTTAGSSNNTSTKENNDSELWNFLDVSRVSFSDSDK